MYLHYMFITLVGMLFIVHGSFHEFTLGNEFKVHECITSSKQKFLLTVISIQTYIHTFIHTRGTVAHSSYSMGIFNQCPRYQFIYPGSPDGLKICCLCLICDQYVICETVIDRINVVGILWEYCGNKPLI